MATKAQLISFIIDMFMGPDGEPVQKSKLDGLKKADLEELIKSRGLEDKLQVWLQTNS